MTMSHDAGGHAAIAAGARLSIACANLARWAKALVRPPRRSAQVRRWAPAWKRLLPHGMVLAAIAGGAMLWLDAEVIGASVRLPPTIVAVFEEITDFGRSGWFLFPIGALILLLAALTSPTLDRASQAVAAMIAIRLGYIFVAIGLPGLVVTIVKRWIGRVRPSENGPFAYEPFSWRPEYASLPSGHAATAFGALVAIGALWPRARPFLWVYALAIGLSRLVVTAHYPSDVIVGAAYGAFGAILVREWFAARGLGFYIGSDGGVHARPGPSFARVRRLARALFAR